jgi:hypothetical protein
MFSFVLGAVKKVAQVIGGETLEKATDVINAIQGKANVDPEVEKAMLSQEVELQKLMVQDAADARQLIREEGKSEDPFVRRARPAFLWFGILLFAFNFAILPLLNVILAFFSKSPVLFVFPQLPDQIYTLFEVSFLGYGAFRTADKYTKGKYGSSVIDKLSGGKR